MTARPHGAALAAILAFFGFFFVMGLWFIARNSATFDEPMHYYAGYAYWEDGDFAVSYHLPALSKEIAVLPVHVLSRLGLVATPRFAHASENPTAGLDLLFRSPLSTAAQLWLARVPMLLLGLLAVAVVARWSHRLWGPTAAIVATGFAVTEPTLIAHSSLVTPDIALTCFYLLFFYLLWRYGEDGTWRTLVLAGVALGAALGAKYPAILALPAAGAIMTLDATSGAWALPFQRGTTLLSERGTTPRGSWHHLLRAALLLVALGAIAALTVIAVYAVRHVGYWLDGFLYQLERSTQAQSAYLAGRYADHGWWYYFPLAFALKTPLPTLIAIVAALALPQVGVSWRRREALFLLVPPALFLGAMMSGGVNIGIRYILPVYPFLFILIARLAAVGTRRLVPALLLGAIAWNAAGTVALAPHFLASASVLAGGPKGLPRWLSDSNVDWGQGLDDLRRYMEREQIPSLYLSYFGMARPTDYGIRYQYIPGFSSDDLDLLPEVSATELLAISVTNLTGVHLPDHDLYAWLRDKEPIARLGYAIYVYDLSGDPELHCRLADAYGVTQQPQHQSLERARCRASADPKRRRG